MKRIALSIAAFFAVHLALAYLMWVGGFNFDSRNWGTGYLALLGLVSGVLVAIAVYRSVKGETE